MLSSEPSAAVSPGPSAAGSSEPTLFPTLSPSVATTSAPSASSVPSFASKSVPAGALYYEGFEGGTFPDLEPEWSTTGDAPWELTSERGNSGAYSIRSPDLSTEDLDPASSNVTLVTDPDWEGGILVYSILSGWSMPYDDLALYVDGASRGLVAGSTEFEESRILLGPGPHAVTWSYRYNPVPLESFPPSTPGRIGAVFLDDVYFLPDGVTPEPTPGPTAPDGPAVPTEAPSAESDEPSYVPSSSSGSATPGPTASAPPTPSTTGSGPGTAGPAASAPPTPQLGEPTSSAPPTPSSAPSAPSTAAPAPIPPGAIYYDGFERGDFPDLGWSTEGDEPWALTTERANGGAYSIRSPALFDGDSARSDTANVTLVTDPAWGPGTLVFSVLAGVNMPFDDFLYYVDGVMRNQLTAMEGFQTRRVELGPGAHVVTWSYLTNPVGIGAFPPMPDGRIGSAYIDDVYFLPAGSTIAPTAGPSATAGPTTTTSFPTSPKPTQAPGSPVPATAIPTASDSPTLAGGSNGSVVPTPATIPSTIAPTPVTPGAIYFVSFELGTFPDDPEWTTGGDAPWELATDRARTGAYSIRSPDLDSGALTPASSNVTLATNPGWGDGTLVFSVLNGVEMPYDDLLLYVDGALREQMTETAEFRTKKIVLGPGAHVVTWSYRYNPVPLDSFPPLPAGRIGAAFLDDVYFLPDGVTVAPTAAPTEPAPTTPAPTMTVPSDIPTPASVPSTAAPTSLPPGAIYFDGFEQGGFPDDPEWTNEGDGSWELTSERSASGVYSIRSPDLMDPDDTSPKDANVTLVTGLAWNAGTLVFSVLAGGEMPFDNLLVLVDGEIRTQLSGSTAFRTEQVRLAPGPHTITWSYKTNPTGTEVFPPLPVGRVGAVFLDDVYFLPEGVTVAPTGAPSPDAPAVPTGAPTTYFPTSSSGDSSDELTYVPTVPETVISSTVFPTLFPTAGEPIATAAPASASPTSVPPGALFYDGFERGTFPDDPEWSTVGRDAWRLDDLANNGRYSIRSPDLANDGFVPYDSNVTLSYGDSDFAGGSLVLSVLAGVERPFDELSYYVDGADAVVMEGGTQFEQLEVPLGPGPHEITFQYSYNPFSLDQLQPPSPGQVGAVYIDDVYVVPFADAFFDGFESGDFTALDWTVGGEMAWAVDGTRPYAGSFSAHVRTEDISASGEESRLDLSVTLATAAFVQFYFQAPVALPWESFNLSVDGQFLTGLSTTVDGAWAQGGAFVSRGEHVISWVLARNPGGVPDAALDSIDSPASRLGEAWLDDVVMLSATPSFVETWESGGFEARPWTLSGNASWSLTDAVRYEGENSATIASSDFAGNAGVAELSIDIITEQGGVLRFRVLPDVSGPFEVGNVLLDDIIVTTYSTPIQEWLAQEISIQPGKRKVTFQLFKNPGGVPAEGLALIPSSHAAQMWLDRIEFVATAPPS